MIDAGYDGLTNGLHRVNALLSWWGVSDAGDDREIEAQIARLERFTAHLQQACRATHGRQLATALSTKDSLTCLVQDLARCQRPNDVMAVESAMVATLLDAAVAQARMWTELACEIQASCRDEPRGERVLRREAAKPEDPDAPAATEPRGKSSGSRTAPMPDQ